LGADPTRVRTSGPREAFALPAFGYHRVVDAVEDAPLRREATMSSWLKILAVGLASTTVGCGGGGGGGGDGDPLEGTWVEKTTGQGEAFQYTFVLEADDKANVEEIVVTPPAGETCGGTLHFDGLKWSHSTTTFTISGSNCSGGIHCNGTSSASFYECNKPPKEQRIACTYSLSTDENTLELSEFDVDKVTFGPTTFERMK
jgi:hypothetical protein